MPKEVERYSKGDLKARFWDEGLREAEEKEKEILSMRKVIKAEDMPWEMSRDGKLKHIAHEKMSTRLQTLNVYLQEILPGSRTGKHRHFSEELFYVLEGKGYDIHFDPEFPVKEEKYVWGIQKEEKRFNWEEGDLVYIPVMVAHQHFNLDSAKPARIIVSNSRLLKHMGHPLIEQLENAPEYDPGK
jgi:quercetin dioxygenase-like cupin family protein